MSSSLILKKIAENTLVGSGGESVKVQSFWADNDVVIYFLRRFGCSVCRWISKNLSSIKPILDENNVKLIGIGPEQNGLEDFVKGNYFSGSIFVDEKKNCYKDLEYGQFSFMGALGAATDKGTREIADKAKKEGITGNIKGDWYQLGGLLVVKKGGEEVLLNFKQVKASDHVSNQQVLDALGIKAQPQSAGASAPTCSEDVCSM